MVAYMWNTDRKAVFIKIIDALEMVTAQPESEMQTVDLEPIIPDFADDAADSGPASPDVLRPADDHDDAQVLHLVRMWSGFESEMFRCPTDRTFGS